MCAGAHPHLKKGATLGLPREQEEQFAHSQPRHGGFGRREKKTPNIQNPSLRAIM